MGRDILFIMHKRVFGLLLLCLIFQCGVANHTKLWNDALIREIRSSSESDTNTDDDGHGLLFALIYKKHHHKPLEKFLIFRLILGGNNQQTTTTQKHPVDGITGYMTTEHTGN